LPFYFVGLNYTFLLNNNLSLYLCMYYLSSASQHKKTLPTIPEGQSETQLLKIMTDRLKDLHENKEEAAGEENIYTKIALGNCIQEIISTQQPDISSSSSNSNNKSTTSSSLSSNAQYHLKSIEDLKREETLGVPIPQKKQTAISVDCTDFQPGISISGRSSPSHFYGSPSSPPIYLSPSTGTGSSSRPGSGRVSRAASPCTVHSGSSSAQQRLELVSNFKTKTCKNKHF
jgi:hypothetical protein